MPSIEAVAGTTRQITARKRAEAELAKAHAEAQKAVRLKDEFLATLSHELRTPMSAIMGWTQVLERRSSGGDDMTRRATEAILRNARAQARLIEDIVDLSRIEAGKVRLTLQPVDVAQAARAAAESLAPPAEAKPVAIDIAVPERPAIVTADPDRLQQILWNLLSNAVKFTMPDGRVAVRIRHDGAHVVVDVADDGIGIHPDFLPHVFDRFRQADGSTTRRAGGLGIGLAVAQQLARLQGGVLVAASAGEGQGATFTLTLHGIDTQVTPPDAAGAPDVDLPQVPLAGVIVLVVDDEPDIRTLLSQLLEEAGARVLVAEERRGRTRARAAAASAGGAVRPADAAPGWLRVPPPVSARSSVTACPRSRSRRWRRPRIASARRTRAIGPFSRSRCSPTRSWPRSAPRPHDRPRGTRDVR